MFGLDESLAHLSGGGALALVLVVSLLLGLRHASNPDHLAAVTTLAAGTEVPVRRAAQLGFAWGAGHATSLALEPEFWEVLKKGNNLRNAIAHGDKNGTIAQRIADLKKALLGWSSPEQRPGVEGMTETQMVSTAFNLTGSFLVVAALKLEGKY